MGWRLRKVSEALHTGHVISGAGHAAIIGWVLFGSAFRSDPPPMEVTEVAVISASDFAALTAPAPSAVTDVALPQPPAQTQDAPKTESAVQPVAPATPPRDVAAPEPETVPDTPEPEPLPVPEVAPESPAPSAPLPSPPVPQISERPVPRPSERIAPEAAPAPAPEAAPAPVEQAAVTPDEAQSDTPQDQQEQDQTAPEEAATEITTEAETPSAAPTTSLRPPSRRPSPPVRQAEAPEAPEAEPTPEPDTTAAADTDAVNAALNEALAGSNTQPDIPLGPPLTSGEKDGLRVAVQKCWNVGALSSAALETTVVVGVALSEDGKPQSNTIRMLSSSGGTATSARQAFDAARRAILRCGAKGFDLPAEKYGQWKDIEMTFNPERMRIK